MGALVYTRVVAPLMTAPATFYRRPLPEGLTPFASAGGRLLFQEALAEGGMQGWFALAEQFHTQSDPAFCGLGSLVMALNALEIDPGRIWKGAWRWYSEELLDCCLPLAEVQSKGVTLEELACLARCNGAHALPQYADTADVNALREAIVQAATSPRGPILIASYARRVLGQTGDGHFSPVAGYHRGRDLVLVLDVARFKYPPHWIPLPLLHEAMQPVDPTSGRSRGWIMLERNQQASALLFRIVNYEDAQAISRTLFEQPSKIDHESSATFAQTFAHHTSTTAKLWMERALTDTAALLPEHQDALAELRSQLRGTNALKLVRPDDDSDVSHSDEAVAMLLLAMPESLLRSWHAPETLRQELQLDPSQTALAAEVASLRAQLLTLCLWRDRSRGASCHAQHEE
jgi:hypothetical protein